MAEIAEKYLVKGKQVYVEGKLTNRSYTDKEGQVKHTTEIVGQHLVLLGSGKGSTEEATNAAPAKPPNNITLEDNDDGLPF